MKEISMGDRYLWSGLWRLKAKREAVRLQFFGDFCLHLRVERLNHIAKRKLQMRTAIFLPVLCKFPAWI